MSGLREEFKYVILPPDGFHLTLRDTITNARNLVPGLLEVIKRIQRPGERILVKYRTENQRKMFPTTAQSLVGYGTLLDLCGPGTIVVGKPGSATWECLLNNINFFAFWNMQQNCGNRFTSSAALVSLSAVLKIARTNEELYDNLCHGTTYQPGKSKLDLINLNGMRLSEIVSTILENKCSKRE